MTMSRQEKKTVTEHMGVDIELNLSTGKFVVEALGRNDLDSLDAAKKAIKKSQEQNNKVQRRTVLVHDDSYGYDDEDSKDPWREGELTSFSARGRNRLHANIMYGKERSEIDPDELYENTKENRALANRVWEITKQIVALKRERDDIMAKKMQRVPVPTGSEE
jgi:hypothetical protein